MAGECFGVLAELEFQQLEVATTREGKQQIRIRGSIYNKYDNDNKRPIYSYVTIFCDNDYLQKQVIALGLPQKPPENQKIYLMVPFRNLTWEVYIGKDGSPRGSATATLSGPIYVQYPRPRPERSGGNHAGTNPGYPAASVPQAAVAPAPHYSVPESGRVPMGQPQPAYANPAPAATPNPNYVPPPTATPWANNDPYTS